MCENSTAKPALEAKQASYGASAGDSLPQPADPPSPTVKRKVDEVDQSTEINSSKRRKGTAPVREEFLVKSDDPTETKQALEGADDDAAEAFRHKDRQPSSQNSKGKRREKTT